jgi:GNAT superfamily N-acetyltransferase
MIEVREARRDDADACARAHIAGWRVGYRGIIPDDHLDAPTFASERLDRWRGWTWQARGGAQQLFVGVRDELVVGFGHCGPERAVPDCDQAGSAPGNGPLLPGSDRFGEIYGFYVHPDAWGSGVASAMMARCSEWMRDIGFLRATLWVLRDNPRARRFYEKVGWELTGRETPWLGPHAAVPLPAPVIEVQYGVTLIS